MGNHDVGKAFASVFEAISADLERSSREQVLAVMDSVGRHYKGIDAEFDDYDDPSHPFGQALIKAFAPDGFPPVPSDDASDAEQDSWHDLWYEQVYKPFKERYDFC